MGQLSFQIDANGFDSLTVEDMGDDCLTLCQPNERGKVERVAVSREMLLAVLDATASRYGTAKNTDQAAQAA